MSIGNSGATSSAVAAVLDLAVVFFVAFGFVALAVVARVFVVGVRFLAGFLVAALCSSSKG